MRKINILESIRFAYESVTGDKFRAFLSLLGVTIGIFSIVAVFTAIDGLEKNIRGIFASLGTDVVYIDKISWDAATQEGFKWWEYRERPNNTYEEFEYLQDNCPLADKVALSINTTSSLKNGRHSIASAGVQGITYDWNAISYFEIDNGRYFTTSEAANGAPVAIIGAQVAEELFPQQNPVNQSFKIGGYSVRVIGVIKKKGVSAFDPTSYDKTVLVTVPFLRNFVDMRRSSPSIIVHRAPGADEEEFEGQLRIAMRNIRRLKPIQNDNFAINKMSFLDDALGQLFSVLAGAGWVIGGFSILIGAFGIANIMFVSVKERTHIIGIEKAMGAKSIFILLQFLCEAAFLSIFGGIIGILIVWALAAFVTQQYNFELSLTISNILRGVIISAIVGLVAGLIPSMQAARMSPVEAMNQH